MAGSDYIIRFTKGVGVPYLVYLSLSLLLVASNVHAGLPEQQPNARAIALGGSGVAINDPWSVFSNQAIMATGRDLWVGAHHQNLFLAPDLNFSALGAAVPIHRGMVGVSLKRLGFSEFHQSKGGLAYALPLTPTLSIGAQGNVHYVWALGEYGSTYALTAEGGICYTPNQRLLFGFHLLNPTHNKLHDDFRIPAIYRVGCSFWLSDSFMLVSQLEQRVGVEVVVSGGLEYYPIPRFAVRSGIMTNPSVACFGIGYALGGLSIDVAFSYHQRLGYSPHLSVSYIFAKPDVETNAIGLP